MRYASAFRLGEYVLQTEKAVLESPAHFDGASRERDDGCAPLLRAIVDAHAALATRLIEHGRLCNARRCDRGMNDAIWSFAISMSLAMSCGKCSYQDTQRLDVVLALVEEPRSEW